MGSQADRYPNGIKPVHPKIPIIKLAQGQQIFLEAYCIKGIGKNHAKWSPASTAFYKLAPKVNIK